MSDKVKSARVIDFGDASSTFVDEIVQIEEFGAVTHLTFAMSQRGDIGDADGQYQRRVICRLIIPTQSRTQMARLLLTGTGALAQSYRTDQATH